MKEIVKSVPRTQINWNELPTNPIIGFFLGTKGWLQRNGYNENKFSLCSVQSFELGNRWLMTPTEGALMVREVKDLNIAFNFLKKYATKVYLFDTPQELFRWLSE